MKNFIAFLILCAVIIIPARLVGSATIVDCIVVEINNKEIIKSFDLKAEEKFREVDCLPPLFKGFRSRNDLESFIDEILLAKVGLEELEKNISSINRNFGLWVEKRDEWVGGEFGDVLYIWSGHMDDFFKKIIALGKIGEGDGNDLKKLIENWKDFLLVELFFPDESCSARKKDVRKIILTATEELGMDFSYVEKRFLQRAFAKRAFEEISKVAEGKAQVIPAEIKKYYEDFSKGQDELFEKIKNQKKNDIILKKLQDIRSKVIVRVHNDFAEFIADSGYNLYKLSE
ncbi:MAG: hypothetical protein US76_04170 [Parcubacteria group bacterium GW2011_GWA2_38_13b]|nr:MAG: hypothetical protein US76_04170 [Parcubacteria group bacterium GW2011_GWA2_38_13b]